MDHIPGSPEILDLDQHPPQINNYSRSGTNMDHKRQKTSHVAAASRRHIKISRDEDDEVPDPVSPRRRHNKAHDLRSGYFAELQQPAEPIEIDSDEEHPSQGQLGRRNGSVSDERTSDAARALSDSRDQTVSSLAAVAKQKPDRLGRLPKQEPEGDRLRYPVSDSEPETAIESRETHNERLRSSIILVEPNRKSPAAGLPKDNNNFLNGPPLRSPYFMKKDSLGCLDMHLSSDEEIASKSVKPSLLTTISSSDHPFGAQSEGTTYKFFIEGLGNAIQVRKKGWQVLISENGFRFTNPDDKEDVRSSIDRDNIDSWIWLDSVLVIHLTLKKGISKLGPSKQVYITLAAKEEQRFIGMLQDKTPKDKLFAKFTHGTPQREASCKSSFDSLHGVSNHSPLNNHQSHNSISVAASPISPRLDSLRDSSSPLSQFRARANGSRTRPEEIQSTTRPSRVFKEVYQAAVPTTSQPFKIALPKGRDHTEKDRQSLVDAQEVTIRSQNVERSAQPAEHLLDPGLGNRTRSAARSAQEKITRDARSSEPLLIYPNVKGQNSVTLYEEDLDRLQPDEFLNDSIVEFYLRYNYDSLPETTRSSAHVFNTFFYQRLTQKRDKEANYEAVRKWTSKSKGVDLFSKKFVVIPINENLHWYLAVVVNLDKVIFGPDVLKATEVSCIHAEEEIDQDESEPISGLTSPRTEPLNTENLLAELEDFDKIEQEPAHTDGEQALARVLSPDQNNASVESQPTIRETPPAVLEASTFPNVTKANEVLEFHEEEQLARPTSRLSLTEQIKAEERAKNPGLIARLQDEHGEDQPFDQTITKDSSQEQSVIELGKSIRSYSKRSKAKRPVSGYSKRGNHIDANRPTIIILDSLNNSHNKVHEVIKDYLVREAKDKRQEILNSQQLATCKADLPTQDNFSDCGLFLIQYADTLLREPDVVPNLLNKVKYNNPSALMAHRRSFHGLFEIDRIPLRRKEMISQLKSLSVPYREHARREEQQRKHERAIARRDQDFLAHSDSEQGIEEADQDNSCALLSGDPSKEKDHKADSLDRRPVAEFSGPVSVTDPMPIEGIIDSQESIVSRQPSPVFLAPADPVRQVVAATVAGRPSTGASHEDSIDELNFL